METFILVNPPKDAFNFAPPSQHPTQSDSIPYQLYRNIIVINKYISLYSLYCINNASKSHSNNDACCTYLLDTLSLHFLFSILSLLSPPFLNCDKKLIDLHVRKGFSKSSSAHFQRKFRHDQRL